MEEISPNKFLITVFLISLIFFVLGASVLPVLPFTTDVVKKAGSFSFFSGLSLASWFLSLIMFIYWIKQEKVEKLPHRRWFLITYASILLVSIVLYPPIINRLFPDWENYLVSVSYPLLFYGGLTALSNYLIYNFGLGAKCLVKNKEKYDNARLLSTFVTIVSLISIASGFVLSNNRYLPEEIQLSYNRAIVAGAYCLIPVATFCLGFIAQLIQNSIVKKITLSVSLIFGFFLGITVLSTLAINRYFLSSGILLSLSIGLLIALWEENTNLEACT